MREIKFRAWHTRLNQWVYFTLEDALYGKVFSYDRSKWWDIEDVSALTNESRFTGLLDKNGVEIWEGDIYCAGTGRYKHNYLVVWDTLIEHGEGDDFETGIGFNVSPDMKEYIQVIGNVYENPYLLEKTL
jgi:uncharacterized phage protein (TIGR01671 family)